MNISNYLQNLAATPRCNKPFYTAKRTYKCLARGVHGVHFDEVEGEARTEWSYNGTGNILRNRAACLGCGEVVESSHTHDFKSCACGSMHVDGGTAYIKRSCTFKDGTSFIDMSLYIPRLRAEVSISQAVTLGWFDPGAACGSCGEHFENNPQPTVQKTYLAPECPSCNEARKEAVLFLATHLRVLHTGDIPAGASCPYRHTCGIYMKNECPRVDEENSFSCAAARGFSLVFPRSIGS